MRNTLEVGLGLLVAAGSFGCSEDQEVQEQQPRRKFSGYETKVVFIPEYRLDILDADHPISTLEEKLLLPITGTGMFVNKKYLIRPVSANVINTYTREGWEIKNARRARSKYFRQKLSKFLCPEHQHEPGTYMYDMVKEQMLNIFSQFEWGAEYVLQRPTYKQADK